MTDKNSEFYDAVGRAVLSFSKLEDALCDIFKRLVLCKLTGTAVSEGHFMLAGIFYRFPNFAARAQLVGDLVKNEIDDDAIKDEWKQLAKAVEQIRPIRNAIAHGTAWGSKDGELSLGASIFDAKNRGTLKSRDDIVDAEVDIRSLAEKLEGFAVRINNYLAR